MFEIADGFSVFVKAFQEGIRPQKILSVDEWADKYMRIPYGPAPEPGKYYTSRTPYAREIMRVLSPTHPARRVVAKVASQLMKTQVGINWICASIYQTPANILVLMPTDKLAKRMSSRIEKTIQEIPELRDLVAKPRSRDSRNTIDTKEFRGGTLYIATARSAANLAEVPARYVYGDEIDRWEASVDGEGSPIDLAENRASTFGTRAKFYYTSSPTLEGASAIDDLFKQGDQRRYYVPCPKCAHMHVFQLEQFRWSDDLTDAWMLCPECGFHIKNHHKGEILQYGEWRTHAQGDGETVSFELSSFYAPVGWVDFVTLARQYVRAKTSVSRGDTESMQVFYNTRLALTWSYREEYVKADELRALVEDYPLGTVPMPALVLTAAVDTQGDRLEVKTIGWGPGLERWVVNIHVVPGDPRDQATWRALDEILLEPVPHASGAALVISAVAIDTGGHATQEVYDFCRTRQRRMVHGMEQRVIAIKGAPKPGRPVISTRPTPVDITKAGRTEKRGAMLWIVGVDTAKDWIYHRLTLTNGPGAVHYSKELPDEYFYQMTAEYRHVRYVKGFKKVEWIKDRNMRNEQFDLEVYNLAAAHHLELHRKPDLWWQRLRERILAKAKEKEAQQEVVQSDKQKETQALVERPARKRSGNFATTW